MRQFICSVRISINLRIVQAYFPPISQSEGVPVRIQDVKGNEWTFQFRFWPNNNSRMYVLEGVTPCIQSMQLRAGDTGIMLLSRMSMHVPSEYLLLIRNSYLLYTSYIGRA